MRIHEKWASVVKALNLDLKKPLNRVTARKIKEITGEEPRIMAKMDASSDLPQIFRTEGVFVLPVSNGEYIIVRGNGYHDLESPVLPPRKFQSTMPFDLVSSRVGRSEMQYVDLAYNAGLIEHFARVDSLYLSVRGRKFSPPFDFHVGDSPIHVEGVQVEIDGGFEGEWTFVALEAKIDRAGDFHIRQLYYPVRSWEENLHSGGVPKEVRPMFFVYDTRARSYTLWEYRFRSPKDYESIELVRSESFVLEWKPLDLDRFQAIAPEGDSQRRLIVPQADDVSKIGELPFLVWLGINRADKMAKQFGFDRRQSSYYSQAAEALGLIELRNALYKLTELGREYVGKPAPERNEMLCKLMLRLPLLNEVLATMLLAQGQTITVHQIADLIRNRGYSGSTLGRRARTVLAWFGWMEQSFGLVEVHNDRISLHRRQRRLSTV